MQFVRRLFSPSPKKFRKLFVAELRKNGDERPWTILPDSSELVMAPGPSAPLEDRVSLLEPYQEYLSVSRSLRAERVRRLAVAVLAKDPPIQFEKAREHLLPIIAQRVSRETFRHKPWQDGEVVHQRFCSDLEVWLAYDTEYGKTHILQKQLERWGVTHDEVFDVALANLRDRSVEQMRKLQEGFYVSTWHDTYDPSRLLLPDLIYRHRVFGKPVAMMPTKDRVYLTGDRDEAGLRMLVDAAKQEAGSFRFLTLKLLRLTDDKWEEYVPDPLQALLANLRRIEESRSYSSVHELLEKVAGQDVAIGGYLLLQEQTSGKLVSWCLWGDAMNTLLPVADLICFVRLGDHGTIENYYVPWEDVEWACGELLISTEYYPPRFAVYAFPDEAQMEYLRQRAVPVSPNHNVKISISNGELRINPSPLSFSVREFGQFVLLPE